MVQILDSNGFEQNIVEKTLSKNSAYSAYPTTICLF